MNQYQEILTLLSNASNFPQIGIIENVLSLFKLCIFYCKYYDIYNDTKIPYQSLKYHFKGGFEAETEKQIDDKITDLYNSIGAGFYLQTVEYGMDNAYSHILYNTAEEIEWNTKTWKTFQSNINEYKRIKEKYENEYKITFTHSQNTLTEKCVLRLLHKKSLDLIETRCKNNTEFDGICLLFEIAQIRKILTTGKISEYSSGRKKEYFNIECTRNLDQLKNYISKLDCLVEIYDECNATFQEELEKFLQTK